jgi:hypothetical protein
MAANVVYDRLLEHWRRERTVREKARAALPASWRNDRRPRMHEVREAYIEAMLHNNHSSGLIAINDDDR